MLKTSIFVMVAALLPAQAFAGCTEVASDGSPGPQATICAAGKCETTELKTICANASGAIYSYKNETAIVLTGPESTEGQGARFVAGDIEEPVFECRTTEEGACPPVMP